MKRARRLDSPVVSESFLDVSGGINGGISDMGAPIRHDKLSNNIVYEPDRARSSRDGFRALTSLLLPYAPNSVMRYYPASGATKTFVAAGTKIYLIENGGGFVDQTLPVTPLLDRKWSHANINGMLFCAQEYSTDPPIFYNGTAWLSSTLPVPATTNVVIAHTAAGNVDVGTHLWRIRWRFTNGASLASASISHEVTGSASTVEFTVLPISSRSDYVGFSIERTIVGEAGLWYAVGDSASKTAVIFTDNTADADLGDLVPAEPGIFGAAPHFDGVIAHQDLLFGWVGSNLYVSDAIGADYGTGCLNFHPYFYQVKADDGDPIKIAVQQLDRLVVIKGSSMHAFTGFDRDSFSCTQIHGEVGTPSTRGAVSDGARVFIYGGRSRIFVLDGQIVRGFGNPQITHYLDTIALTSEDHVEVVNYRGDKILFGYPAYSSGTNDEVLAFSMLNRNWEHYTGIRLSGCLCPKNDSEFGGATMVYGDPKIFDPMAVPAGAQAPTLQAPFYVAWIDSRFTPALYKQAFSQLIDKQGYSDWDASGKQISTGLIDSSAVSICATTPSGCVIVLVRYGDSTTLNLTATRYGATGESLWTSPVKTTTPVSAAYNTPPVVWETEDGSIIVVWAKSSNPPIYSGQKFSSSGAVQWGVDGKVLATGVSGSYPFEACTDGSNGLWLTYNQQGSPYSKKIRRFDSSGIQVGSETYISDSGRAQVTGNILADGEGGFWFSWGENYYAFICRYDSSGAQVFAPTALAGASASSITAEMTSDGAGGVWASFYNYPGSGGTLWSRRVGPGGLLGTATPLLYWSSTHGIARDSVGGYYIVSSLSISGNWWLVIRRFSPTGNPMWDNYVVVDSSHDSIGAHWNFTLKDMIPDGADGVYVVYSVNSTNYAENIKCNRVDPNGVLWDVNGRVICDEIKIQTGEVVALQGVPYGGLPSTPASGYRVWSLFDGETDEAAFDGSSGVRIPVMFETPEYDAGEPDVMKAIDRLQFYVKQGKADFLATVQTDIAASSVALTLNQSVATWGYGTDAVPSTTRPVTTLEWGSDGLHGTPVIAQHTGGKWAGKVAGAATVGVPSGTTGKWFKLVVRADVLEKLILSGHVVDFQLLPERPYV
jgi:hypothetical protein